MFMFDISAIKTVFLCIKLNRDGQENNAVKWHGAFPESQEAVGSRQWSLLIWKLPFS